MILDKKRIFYFEDDPRNRAIAQMILEHSGAVFGFDRWGSANGIMRLLGFAPIDMILLDLMYPNNVTGYDILRMIKAEPALAGIPVVAVSAADPASEIPKARAAGFSGYIAKPIDMRLFPTQLAEILNHQQVWHGR